MGDNEKRDQNDFLPKPLTKEQIDERLLALANLAPQLMEMTAVYGSAKLIRRIGRRFLLFLGAAVTFVAVFGENIAKIIKMLVAGKGG